MTDKTTGILVGLLILVIGVGIFGYLTISRGKDAADKIIEVEMPMEQTIREVEVSIWETANAVFYYMIEPSKIALEEYKKQLKDVEKFMTEYKNLIDTDEEKQMVAKFEKMWSDTVSKAEELIKLYDKILKTEENAWDAAQDVDNIIDYKIDPALLEGIPDILEKDKLIGEIEESVWEAANAVNFYLLKRSDKAKREFPKQLEDVGDMLEKYKKLNLTPTEESHVKEFEDLWSRAVRLMKECLALADVLKEKKLALWESVHAADDVIDFDIQEYMKKRTEKVTR